MAPVVLSACLLWPIFLPRYQLVGGASFEILMINGLKAAFNQALLRGEFPLWNEWVACGKVFLPFGASPISIFTPLELIVDPQIGKLTYAVELLLAYSIAAWMFLRLCSWLGVATWIAPLGFFAYFLMQPMPHYAHWLGWMGLVVFGAALVILFALHLATGDARLILPSLICSVLLAPGARPDGFPVMVVVLASVSGLEMTRALMAGEGRKALIVFAQRAGAFVVLPLAFYAWQIPLVVSLSRVSLVRLWHVEIPIGVTLGHLGTAVSLSTTAKLAAGWAAIGVAHWLLERDAAHRRVGGRGPLSPTPLSITALSLLGVAAWTIAGLPHRAVIVSALMAGAIALQWPALRAGGVSLRRAWGYPAVAAGVHTVFEFSAFETLLPVPWKLSLLFLGLVIYGAVAGFTASGDDSRGRLSRSLVSMLVVLWIWREFLSLPLYEIANIILPVGRDFALTSPPVVVLFLIAVDRLWERGGRALLTHPASGARWASRVVLAVLAVRLAAAVLLSFYVPKGERLYNEVWRHFTKAEMNRHEERLAQREELFRLVRKERGEDARILTQLMDNIGFPGAAAGRGVREAWGYDHIADSYRELAERAFSVHDLAAFPRDFPRLIYYNPHAAAVYRHHRQGSLASSDETPTAFDERVDRTYLRLLVIKSSHDVDPFFLELLRVGGLIVAHGAPSGTDGLEQIDPERDMKLWGRPAAYRVKPQRALRRFGFMPRHEAGESARDLLTSHSRGELARAYARLTLAEAEDAAAAVRIAATALTANRQSFVVESARPGFLVIFDSWHPDWHATVNGTSVPIERAFVNLRAVPIPAGHSVVELVFEPPGWRLAVAISGLAVVGTAVSLPLMLRSRRRVA